MSWPKVDGDDVLLSDFNELVDEFNLRTGRTGLPTAIPQFTCGYVTREAIVTLRRAVEGLMPKQHPYPPYDWPWYGVWHNEDGVQYAPVGKETDEDGTWINVFEELFGEGRTCWLNDSIGTEVHGQWWYGGYQDSDTGNTPKCSLQDSEPYIFHLNELYTVIHHIEWISFPLTSLGTVSRHGIGGGDEACTKQEALDAAWTALLASGSGGNISHLYATWGCIYNDPSWPHIELSQGQRFYSTDLPAGFTAVKLRLQCAANWYIGSSGNAEKPPTYNLVVRSGTIDPGALTIADWDYGAVISSQAVTDQMIDAAPVDVLVDLTNLLDDGVVNYLCLAASDQSTKPQFIVDSGYWLYSGGLDRLHNPNFHPILAKYVP